MINNASSDHTEEMLAEYKDIIAVNNKDNLGCAGGWNQAYHEPRRVDCRSQ